MDGQELFSYLEDALAAGQVGRQLDSHLLHPGPLRGEVGGELAPARALHGQRVGEETLAAGPGEDRVVGTEGECEEAQVVGHQVDLNVDHLAGCVAPRYGPRGKLPARHVVLRAAEVVPAESAPSPVDGVELGGEAAAVESVVVPVLERGGGGHQSAIICIKIYLGQVTVRSEDSYGGPTWWFQPLGMRECLPGSVQEQQHHQHR